MSETLFGSQMRFGSSKPRKGRYEWPYPVSRHLREQIEAIGRRGFTPDEAWKWRKMQQAEAKARASE